MLYIRTSRKIQSFSRRVFLSRAGNDLSCDTPQRACRGKKKENSYFYRICKFPPLARRRSFIQWSLGWKKEKKKKSVGLVQWGDISPLKPDEGRRWLATRSPNETCPGKKNAMIDNVTLHGGETWIILFTGIYAWLRLLVCACPPSCLPVQARLLPSAASNTVLLSFFFFFALLSVIDFCFVLLICGYPLIISFFFSYLCFLVVLSVLSVCFFSQF